MVELPEGWEELKCRKHPDHPLVLSVQPGHLYCALCMRTYPVSELEPALP